METTSVLNERGTVAEAEDFMPYGGIRMDSKTNYGGVRNKYAGTIYDALSGLNYAQARYQNSSRGQFISEDPVFLVIGNSGQVQQLTKQDQQQLLMDPQQLNSYGYARDNPISKNDPSGLEVKPFSSNPLLATLELYGYVSLVKEANAYFGNTGQSAANRKEAKNQFQVDSFVTLVGFGASATEGAVLTVAGTVLQGVDAYCSGHTCQDFSAAANTTPATVLASLKPKPGTVPSPFGLSKVAPYSPTSVQQKTPDNVKSSPASSPASNNYLTVPMNPSPKPASNANLSQ